MSQYSLSQNKSKSSNTVRFAILCPPARYSLGEKRERNRTGAIEEEEEVSSLRDLRHKIPLLAGLISIYSTRMELLYGTLHLQQRIIDLPSIRDIFHFFFFKPKSFEDRVLLDTCNKIVSYLVAYSQVQK